MPRTLSRLLVLRVTLCLLLGCVAAVGRASGPPPLIGICAAYPPELEALYRELGVSEANGFTRTSLRGLTYWQGKYQGKAIVVFRTGISLVNAAYQLQLALDHFPITHVLFAGVAGGIDPSLHVGDVVIPEAWAYHAEAAYLNPDGAGGYVLPQGFTPAAPNFGMIFPSRTGIVREGEAFERVTHFPVDPDLLAIARRVAPLLPPMQKGGRDITISVGGTGVAGPVFMDNAEYREWVFRTWQARCLDMESTALAQVAYANRTPILIIRALSDLAGAQAGGNPLRENEAKVSEISARVLRAVLDAL